MTAITYRADAPGDWGTMVAPSGGTIGTAILNHPQRPDIFYRYWDVNGPGTLLIMHGLGAHSGWFIDMGNAIAAQGINVYAMDHHGFGRSGGERGHATNAQLFIDDIDRVIDALRLKHPETPIFPLGHSMGGIFGITYASQHASKLGGLILMNPWIEDQTQVNPMTVLSILSGGIFGSKSVVHLPDTKMTASMTTNPAADHLLQNDPYWVYERTKSFYWQITQMKMKVLGEAKKLTLPVFVIQSEADKAVVPAATQKAFDTISSTDKIMRTYPNYDHDCEFQIDRSLLDHDITEWIKEHSRH